MRFSGALRNLPYKTQMLRNELQKPMWDYTSAELKGKDVKYQGPPRKRAPPRIAPHLGEF